MPGKPHEHRAFRLLFRLTAEFERFRDSERLGTLRALRCLLSRQHMRQNPADERRPDGELLVGLQRAAGRGRVLATPGAGARAGGDGGEPSSAHAHGLSFAELLERTGAERDVLARVLADEVRAGRVAHRRTFRRYAIVWEAFEPDVLAALRDLPL
jgi:hypothetical protein